MMPFDDIKEALIIGVILAFMIGPVFFMVIQTSILNGFRAAFSFDLGVVLGDSSFLFLAYFGSKSVLSNIENNPLLFKIGGVVLVVYGVFSFFRPKQKGAILDKSLVIVPKTNYLHLFIKGFFLNIINVGVLGFWFGLIVFYSASFNMNEPRIFKFFLLVLLTYLAVDVGKILLAKKLRDKMTAATIFKMKRLMGIILIVFGIALFSKNYIPTDKINLKNVIETHPSQAK